ncbi:MAG: hypothetical protein V1850_01965 [Candidatus Bathyarchaeota archaeon]
MKEILLGEWAECVGIFERLETNEADVTVVLSINDEKFKLIFPADGAEADIVEKQLLACKSGTMIALLKTDEALRPFVARTIRMQRMPRSPSGDDNILL